MPQKALKITVDLTVQAVTCPGTVLREREDVYISIHFLALQKKTLCLPPIFPLLFHQVIRFEKTFYNCIDLAHLSSLLEDERILIELIQLPEDYSQDGTVLAHFYEPAREFLFPQNTLMSTYADAEREVLMNRTLWFSGISPKLEFSCSTTVKDCSTPGPSSYHELAARQSASDNDFLNVTLDRKSRSRSRTKSYGDSTISWRNKSPARSWHMGRNTSLEDRPPFIMKRENSHNRATSPSKGVSFSNSTTRPLSAPPPINGLSLSSAETKRRRRSPKRRSFSPGSSYISENDCRICRVFKRYYGKPYWGHRKNFHPNHGIKIRPYKNSDELVDEADLWLDRAAQSEIRDNTRGILRSLNDLSITSRSLDPTPGLDVSYGRLPYSPRLSRARSVSPPRARTRSLSPITLSPRRRSRSPSPILSQPSLRDTYATSYSSDLDTSRVIHRRVRKALEHNFHSSDSDVSSVTSEEALADLSSSLRSENREVLRRSLLDSDRSISVHIDNGHHWSTRSSEFTGKSHRELFQDTMDKIYRRLYRNLSESA